MSGLFFSFGKGFEVAWWRHLKFKRRCFKKSKSSKLITSSLKIFETVPEDIYLSCSLLHGWGMASSPACKCGAQLCKLSLCCICYHTNEARRLADFGINTVTRMTAKSPEFDVAVFYLVMMLNKKRGIIRP